METEEKRKIELESLSPISKEIADLMKPYCDEYDFDPNLFEEIEALPPLHAFIVAYGYLSTEGLNAEQILSKYIDKVGLKRD